MSAATVTPPIVRAAPVKADPEGARLGFRLTLPAQVLVLFISVFPLLMQLYISMTDWSPLDGVPWWHAWESWNTFANYTDLAVDDRFWAALGRTAVIMLVCVPAEFLLGFALALLFMDDFRGKRIFYSILLMPMMVVPAVAGYMFFMLFQSGGPVNDIISTLTGSTFSLAWLSSPGWALVAVMIADIWQWTPLMFLILLAGLAGVPEDQLRAATLLGASWPQRFRTIVLPKMKTIVIIALAIRVIENFKIFDTLYIMTGGGP
ncbi:MAG: sugar ABC transporter permease, partial [Rhizobiaceae bacterium]|nr:sugar ABC transporter permease [Rhizobiaceae bacterium]